jgi:hypothetical protein
MIIKVHQHKPRSVLRIFIALFMVVGIMGYYYYHLTYKTEEDNIAFTKKVAKIKKEKKESLRLQRTILNEAEKIILLVGANNITKIRMKKNKLHVYLSDDQYIDTFIVRYGKMMKISKVNNLWDLSIDLKKLLMKIK